jgi:hypothetical protein
LQDNTIVTSIDVEFSAFEGDCSWRPEATIDIDHVVTKATTTADPVLQYIRNSSTLRKIRLEDSNLRSLIPVDEHLSISFYRAIVDNPHQLLQEIRIDYCDDVE